MICLSFDTDHLDDARMAEFTGTVPVPGAGTFFCTQRYGVLDGGPHELCPHPHLRAGDDWEAELEAKRAEFPDAVGWRSHSCVYSHLLGERLARLGYAYVSTHDELGAPDIAPSREAWGVWHLPIFYMDNLDFSLPRFWPDASRTPFDRELIETAVTGDGLYVLDFHPVHLMLNSNSAEGYFERRPRFVAGEPIEALACEGYGTRSFYDELCTRMAEEGVESVAMRDALAAFTGTEPPPPPSADARAAGDTS